jgi:hypothetical protein
MAKLSDREFALKRQVKELEGQVRILKEELHLARKKIQKIEKVAQSDTLPADKKSPPGCPTCHSKLLISELPHATLVMCSERCGYREVKQRK